MNIIRLFNTAGATGHVFLLKGGRAEKKGLAWSGFIGPQTTVAVVPTTSQILEFSVEAQTKDSQQITVTGNIKISFAPEDAVSKFDFTVNPKGGAYVSPWDRTLRAIVIEHVLRPVRASARDIAVEAAMSAQLAFENAVKTAMRGESAPLAEKGIRVESCSVVKITAQDEEVSEALGVNEREEMLTRADQALHKRRLEAAANERVVQTFEAETRLRLEEERTKLLEKQGENKKKEAGDDAAATELRLKALKESEPGKVLGAALLEMAKSGRVGSLSIVPELLTALGSNGSHGR